MMAYISVIQGSETVAQISTGVKCNMHTKTMSVKNKQKVVGVCPLERSLSKLATDKTRGLLATNTQGELNPPIPYMGAKP
jgi:hypothetical protein